MTIFFTVLVLILLNVYLFIKLHKEKFTTLITKIAFEIMISLDTIIDNYKGRRAMVLKIYSKKENKIRSFCKMDIEFERTAIYVKEIKSDFDQFKLNNDFQTHIDILLRNRSIYDADLDNTTGEDSFNNIYREYGAKSYVEIVLHDDIKKGELYTLLVTFNDKYPLSETKRDTLINVSAQSIEKNVRKLKNIKKWILF